MGEAVERQSLIEKTIKARPKTFICLERVFGGNDQLETNTSLQMGHEGIEFKVVQKVVEDILTMRSWAHVRQSTFLAMVTKTSY